MNLVFVWDFINFLQQPWWTGLAAIIGFFTLLFIIIQSLDSKPPEINPASINKNTTQKLYEESYKERTVEVIESAPELLYAIVIGAHFLEPDWFIQKRLKKDGRKKKLRNDFT